MKYMFLVRGISQSNSQYVLAFQEDLDTRFVINNTVPKNKTMCIVYLYWIPRNV